MGEDKGRKPATFDEELLEAETGDVVATESDASRIERVTKELETGFEALAHVGRAVSVFGSARSVPDSPDYRRVYETTRMLADRGFAIITGGGPGAMEAANRAGSDAGVESIGLHIDLPQEESVNRYVNLPLYFHYFFTRKVMFVRYASAFVVFPGGFGTLDELFEALTLIQTEKIHFFPIVLVGSDYWGGLTDWLQERLEGEGKISRGDLDGMTLTDDPDEVVAIVSAAKHRSPRRPRGPEAV